jgi:hypothetical protein
VACRKFVSRAVANIGGTLFVLVILMCSHNGCFVMCRAVRRIVTDSPSGVTFGGVSITCCTIHYVTTSVDGGFLGGLYVAHFKNTSCTAYFSTRHPVEFKYNIKLKYE